MKEIIRFFKWLYWLDQEEERIYRENNRISESESDPMP